MTNESPAGGMTDTVATLLPCPLPWCHGNAVFDWFLEPSLSQVRPGSYQVQCLKCGMRSPERNSKEEAARLWNTRSPDPLKEAVVVAAMNWMNPPNAFKDYLAVENAEHDLRMAVENYQRALATTDKGGK